MMRSLIKVLKLSLILIFFSGITSCFEAEDLDPDPCAGVECNQQFFCIDGDCVCPEGYKVSQFPPGICTEIYPGDYVLTGTEGDTNCLESLQYDVLTKINQPDTLGNEDWSVIYFNGYTRGDRHGRSLEFENIDPSDDAFPIRGTDTWDFDNYLNNSFGYCENLPDYVRMYAELLYTKDSVQLTYRYTDPSTGESLRDPLLLNYVRYEE